MAGSLLLLLLAGCGGVPLAFVDPPGDSGADTAADPGDDTAPADSGVADGDGDGWVGSADCDDGDAAVSPGAEEVCGNGADDDCDGRAEGCGLAGLVIAEESAVASFAVEGPYVVADLDGDDAADLVAVDAEHVDAWTGPLSGELPDAELTGYDVDAAIALGDGLALSTRRNAGEGVLTLLRDPLGDAAVVQLVWDSPGTSALELALAADPDQRGAEDLLVGADDWAGPAGEQSGGAWLHAGPLLDDGDGADGDGEDAAVTYVAEGRADHAGSAVSLAGDADGDGLGDVAIGAYAESTAGYLAGAVYLLPGDLAGVVALADAPTRLLGDGPYAFAGRALSAAGDADGDGLDDLLVGCPSATVDGVQGAGEVWLVARGEVVLRLGGEEADGGLGEAIALGDFDDDGVADLALGEPGARLASENGGAVRVWYGPWTGGAPDATVALLSTDGVWSTEAGEHLAAGDLDGDGFDDLVSRGLVVGGGRGF